MESFCDALTALQRDDDRCCLVTHTGCGEEELSSRGILELGPNGRVQRFLGTKHAVPTNFNLRCGHEYTFRCTHCRVLGCCVFLQGTKGLRHPRKGLLSIVLNGPLL